MKDMMVQDYKITNSDEYKTYLNALCHLASGYVSRIRVRFAEQAYEMYQNETIRKIVLAYGEEYDRREKDRLRAFTHTATYGAVTDECLDDSCLNNASAYGQTIKMLFDIGYRKE